jgi:hypothetical protein
MTESAAVQGPAAAFSFLPPHHDAHVIPPRLIVGLGNPGPNTRITGTTSVSGLSTVWRAS